MCNEIFRRRVLPLNPKKNEINPKKYPPGWISSSAPESGCNIWTSILGLRMYCIQLKKKQTAGDFLRMVNQQQRWRQVTQFLRCFPQRHRFNESSGANTILFIFLQKTGREQAAVRVGRKMDGVSFCCCFQCHPMFPVSSGGQPMSAALTTIFHSQL